MTTVVKLMIGLLTILTSECNVLRHVGDGVLIPMLKSVMSLVVQLLPDTNNVKDGFKRDHLSWSI